jgi:hypothetical protein
LIRRNLALLVALSAASVGCVTQGIPNWLIHVRTTPVDPSAPEDQVARQLVTEMRLPYRGLPDEHMAPEQMAAVALRDIERGDHADAALWLAAASYRYHEEAFDAARRGVAIEPRLAPEVNRKVYRKLLGQEIRRFADFNFLRELEVVSARATGQTDREKALQDQVAALGKPTEIEQQSVREALWQLRPANTAEQRTRYPDVLEAFRWRLRADANADREDEHPETYLAVPPFTALQNEAMLTTTSFFDPWVCAALAESFPVLRPTIVRYLTAPQVWARANAAATLALAPSDETRATLEARLAAETSANVKLAIAYALVHHGVAAQAVTLTAALASCERGTCTLPVMLAQWLPPSAKQEIQQSLVARILNGNQFEPRAHLFAAALARDLGRHQPLEAATVEALIVAARRRGSNDEERVGRVAFEAIADAEVLSRADVVGRLDGHDQSTPGRRNDVLMPAPLIARLTRVSIADDLPLLSELMARFASYETPEAALVVEATLHVPGDQADARLINWMNQHPRLRVQIAVGLAGRTSITPAQRERFLTRAGAAARIIVLKLSKAPDADAVVLRYLRGGTPEDQLAAAELAGITVQASAAPDLWPLVNFRVDSYYPNDALMRHTAMQALLRITLAKTAKPAASPEAVPAVQ